MSNIPNKGMCWLCGIGFVIFAVLFMQMLGTVFFLRPTEQQQTFAIVWMFITAPAALGCFRTLKKNGCSEDLAKKVWIAGWLLGLGWLGLIFFSSLS